MKYNINKKNRLLICSLIILSAFILSSCNSKKEEVSNKYKDEMLVNKYKDEKFGNTMDNILDFGTVVESEEYIYEAINEGIFKIKKDSGYIEKIVDGNCWYLNIWKGYLYYGKIQIYEHEKKPAIYKLNLLDLKEELVIEESVSTMIIKDDWIYYSGGSSDCVKITKVKIDGTNKVDILYEEINENEKDSDDFNNDKFYLLEGWIYYSNPKDMHKLYKIQYDGKNKTKISDEIVNLKFTVYNGWIYYVKKNADFNVYKMKTDGTKKQVLVEKKVYNIYIHKDYILYVNGDDMCKVYKLNLKTLEDTKLSDYYMLGIQVVDNSIYNSGKNIEKTESGYIYKNKNFSMEGTKVGSKYNYDREGKVTKIINTKKDIIEEIDYTYDDFDNVKTEIKNGKEIYEYYYNESNHLTRVDDAFLNKTIMYSYDSIGNMILKSIFDYTKEEMIGQEPIKTIVYKYNNKKFPNAITSFDGKEIVYDEEGNPLNYMGKEMKWSKDRKLISVKTQSDEIKYKYDEEGQFYVKKTGEHELDYYFVKYKLISHIGDVDQEFFYDEKDRLIGFTEYIANENYTYLLNAKGDIKGILDGAGNEVVSYEYNEFGKVESIKGELASTVGIENPLKYRGCYQDEATGFYYIEGEFYDPETGRFIKADYK